MRNVKDIDVTGKRVLVRCDFNEPLDDSGALLDDFRIQKSLPTIQYLLKRAAEVVVMSHLGDGHESMDAVKKRLDELLGVSVKLLENLRANPGEEKNDPSFAEQLAQGFDLYVNDAFSACHRAHASIVGVPMILPSAAGMLLEQELEHLEKVRHNPERPFIAIVGGKKVGTKADFIKNISKIADSVIVGGLIKKELGQALNAKIVGPQDDVNAPDIGKETIKIFKEMIKGAKTVLWNGPLGKIEEKKHRAGTLAIAQAIIDSGAFSVVGGGETIQFLRQEGLLEKFGWASTGGGAMLAYLAGQDLPGLKALNHNS